MANLFWAMKRYIVESSSSEEDENDHGKFQAKRKKDFPSSEDEEDDVKHEKFEKVEVDLRNYVYEPVHFVRAHCKAGEKPEVDTQVKIISCNHILALVVTFLLMGCAYIKFWRILISMACFQ